jgi:hypothetical protein
MAAQAVPTIFVSYCHIDRGIARRLFRRLTAHGVKAWIDEQELKPGAALSASLRNHIQSSDMVVVIATRASGASTWVGMELDFAKEHGKSIVPIFIEPVSKQMRFRDHMGVDATLPQTFEHVIHSLMRDFFASLGLKLPPPDSATLLAGMRDLAREEPDLAPLIHGCLDAEGLNQSNMGTVYGSAFHPLDYALNALFDVRPNDRMAWHAAYGFCLAGAGTRALSSWITTTGNGGQPLVTAVGRELAPSLIGSAIQLLGQCDPPNNHAVYQFIHHNAAQLSEEQRRATIRLVTWPVRDTGQLGDVLGWVAMKNFPQTVELQEMWSGWVQKGCFDGKPNTPHDLARYIANAHNEELAGWEDVSEAVRTHVRGHLRSGDQNRVEIAINHISAAADAKSPVLPALVQEANGVTGSAEWKHWAESDKETSEFMGWYLFHVVQQTKGDRDWDQAWDDAKQMAKFQKERRRILRAQ